jgi:very-short-patch-repair endonuclease
MAFSLRQKLGVKFRRQAAVGAYIVDIVCFSHRLIIELDGPQHLDAEAKTHDARRTAFLETYGFRVIRFRNQELDDNIDAVVEKIKLELKVFESIQNPSPTLPVEGEGAEPS